MCCTALAIRPQWMRHIKASLTVALNHACQYFPALLPICCCSYCKQRLLLCYQKKNAITGCMPNISRTVLSKSSKKEKRKQPNDVFPLRYCDCCIYYNAPVRLWGGMVMQVDVKAQACHIQGSLCTFWNHSWRDVLTIFLPWCGCQLRQSTLHWVIYQHCDKYCNWRTAVGARGLASSRNRSNCCTNAVHRFSCEINKNDSKRR